MFKSLLLSDLDVTVVRLALAMLKGSEAEAIYDAARLIVDTKTKELVGSRLRDDDVDMRYDDATK